MTTAKDFRELNVNGFRVFISTLNSKGKTRIAIVDNENAKNFRDGNIVYQNVFASPFRIQNSEFDKASKAVGLN